MEYSIKFYSDWHCGSGLGASAEMDAEVIKDSQGLPYIPGKTIKGLFSEAKDVLSEYDKRFEELDFGKMYFTNAELNEGIEQDHKKYLFRHIASTAIGENGIAVAKSLRVIEVCIPLELTGSIENVSDQEKQAIAMASKYIKSLGSNRNRGLGRCSITFKEE